MRYVGRTEAAFFERAHGARAREGRGSRRQRAPGPLARFLVNTLHGVRVLARTGVDQSVFDDSVRTALEVLRAPQKNPGRSG